MERKLPPMKALLAFEAVARTGERAQAARELNVTPGAIAKQLRLLEAWIGAPLLDPFGLTAQGRTLAQSLSSGLDLIQSGVAALRPDVTAPEIDLLAPATLAVHWLMPRLPGAGAAVAIRPTHTGEDWQGMPHDLVLRRDSFLPTGYRAEPFGCERLTVGVASGLRGPAGEKPAEFVKRVPRLGAATRPGDTERWLLAAGVPARLGEPIRSYGHLYIAYQAALAGEGWVLAPDLVLADDAARGRLCMPFRDISVEGAALSMIFPATRDVARRTAPVRAWLRTAAGLSQGASN